MRLRLFARSGSSRRARKSRASPPAARTVRDLRQSRGAQDVLDMGQIDRILAMLGGEGLGVDSMSRSQEQGVRLHSQIRTRLS